MKKITTDDITETELDDVVKKVDEVIKREHPTELPRAKTIITNGHGWAVTEGNKAAFVKFKTHALPETRIDMVPLIDSFFLVLVYFIYAFLSMSVHRGIPLTLPEVSTAVEEKKEHYGISIDKQGQIYLEKELISEAALKERLQNFKVESKDVQIFIYGDKDAPHGNVVGVLDVVRQVGIQKVFIETEIENADT